MPRNQNSLLEGAGRHYRVVQAVDPKTIKNISPLKVKYNSPDTLLQGRNAQVHREELRGPSDSFAEDYPISDHVELAATAPRNAPWRPLGSTSISGRNRATKCTSTSLHNRDPWACLLHRHKQLACCHTECSACWGSTTARHLFCKFNPAAEVSALHRLLRPNLSIPLLCELFLQLAIFTPLCFASFSCNSLLIFLSSAHEKSKSSVFDASEQELNFL